MKALGAERLCPQPHAELDGEVAHRHQHIVEIADRLGEAALGMMLGDGNARGDALLDASQRLVQPEDQRGAEAGLQRLAVATSKLADGFQPHLVEASHLGFAQPQGVDGQVGEAGFEFGFGHDAAGVEMGEGPRRSHRVGDRALGAVADGPQPSDQRRKHPLFAAEQV